MKKLTIYDVKYRVKNAPYFFDRKSMKFFNQTLKDFKIEKTENENIFYLYAFMKDRNGKIIGKTERLFDTIKNEFV
jgi:transcription elongation factor GreA-like protein